MKKKSIFSEERERIILRLLESKATVTIDELCEACQVSQSTARKQVASMAEKGLLIRTHGGAMAMDVDIETKLVSQVVPKRSIAQAARESINDGDILLLGSGSTVIELAHLLHDLKDAIVITDSILAAGELMRVEGLEVRICNGTVHGKSGCVVGDQAEAYFQNLSATKCFIGVDGISLDVGVTSDNMLVSQVETRMLKCALQTYVMADSSKLDRVSLTRICQIDEIDHIITDNGADPAYLAQLRQHGVKVTAADVEL